MRGLGFGLGFEMVEHAGATPRATDFWLGSRVGVRGRGVGVGDLTFGVAVVFFVEMGWKVCGFEVSKWAIGKCVVCR